MTIILKLFQFSKIAVQLGVFVFCASPLMVYDLIQYTINENIISVHYSATHSYKLDIYTNPEYKEPLKPVIVYLVGGAWMFATKKYGLTVGKYMQTKDAILVVPDIGNYPYLSIANMIANIQECIQWIVQNIGQYGGNAASITIMGHSSGAFLGLHALHTLKEPLQSSIITFIGIGGPYCHNTLHDTLDGLGLAWLYSLIFKDMSPCIELKQYNTNIKYFIIQTQLDSIVGPGHVNFVKQHLTKNIHVISYPVNHTQLLVEDLLFNNFHFMDFVFSLTHNIMDFPESFTDSTYMNARSMLQSIHETIADANADQPIDSLTNIIQSILDVVSVWDWWYSSLLFINPL